MSCPRRMRESGPWQKQQGLDHWTRDRWSADLAAVREMNIRKCEESPNLHMDVDQRGAWMWECDVPRTCSFCGSIHPDDAIALLKDGWEVETAKPYKRYLNPPGMRTRHEQVCRQIESKGTFDNATLPSFWHPTPPVKLYTMHMTQAQVDEWNALVAEGLG